MKQDIESQMLYFQRTFNTVGKIVVYKRENIEEMSTREF